MGNTLKAGALVSLQRSLGDPYWKAELVDVRNIQIDQYQRSVRPMHLRRMVRRIREEGWNQLVAGAVTLSRRTDGSVFVIDGQHRIKAILEVAGDAPYVQQAIVWYGLSREQESEMFDRQQAADSRLAIVPADIHQARLYQDRGGDPGSQSWRIEEMLQQHGFYIADEFKQPGLTRLSAVKAAYEIEERYGIDIADATFELITQAWGNKHSPDAPIITGTATFVAMFPDARFSVVAKTISKQPMDVWRDEVFRGGDYLRIKGRQTQVTWGLHREYNRAVRVNKLPNFETAYADHIRSTMSRRISKSKQRGKK